MKKPNKLSKGQAKMAEFRARKKTALPNSENIDKWIDMVYESFSKPGLDLSAMKMLHDDTIPSLKLWLLKGDGFSNRPDPVKLLEVIQEKLKARIEALNDAETFGRSKSTMPGKPTTIKKELAFEELFQNKRDRLFVLKAMIDLRITDADHKSILTSRTKSCLAGFVKALLESKQKITIHCAQAPAMKAFQKKIDLTGKIDWNTNKGKEMIKEAIHYFDSNY